MKEKIIKFVLDEKTQIIVKTFVVILLISYILTAAKEAVGYTENHIEKKDKMYILEMCDRHYYEKEFAKLRETLILNDAFEEIFDKYWEVVDGYSDYMQYNQWVLTPGEDVIVAEYRKKVMGNYENLEFEDNKKILKEYYEAVK